MQAPVTHVLPLTLILRSRLLPAPGRVLVRQGQKVNASDIVAECRKLGQHILIDIRRGLAIPRPDEAEKMIERHEGESLKAGDVIAQTKGLLARVVRSPVDGVLVAIHNGRVLLEVPGEVFRLPAGFAGTVNEVLPERGVVMETNGALIQCMWGNDRFDQGLLLLEAHSPEQELKANRLDAILTPGGNGADLAARAGYPIIVVPFGMVPNAPPQQPFQENFHALPAPFGVGFTGAACSEPRLFEIAYAFERATKRRIPPASTP